MADVVVSTVRAREVPSRGGVYKSIYITLPHDMAVDSMFPFKVGDQIIIRIEGNRLVLEALPIRREGP